MKADNFIDTSVLLYAASNAPEEEEKKDIARALLAEGNCGLSVQVMSEFYVNATTKFHLPEDKVTLALKSLEKYPIMPLTKGVFWSAHILQQRYKISFWDSTILASAISLGCKTVYSEDMPHGKSYGYVQSINPFL